MEAHHGQPNASIPLFRPLHGLWLDPGGTAVDRVTDPHTRSQGGSPPGPALCTCRALCGGGAPAIAAVGLGRVERPDVRFAEDALLSGRPPGQHVRSGSRRPRPGLHQPPPACPTRAPSLLGAAAAGSSLTVLQGTGPARCPASSQATSFHWPRRLKLL